MMKTVWKVSCVSLSMAAAAWLGWAADFPALAQIYTPGWQNITMPTGNEQVEIFGPYTERSFMFMKQFRNARNLLLVGTGTTVNTTVPNTVGEVLATGAITTWNVVMPLLPYEGERVEISCPGGTATVSMTATSPASVALVGTAFTTCTGGGVGANASAWVYSATANTWYRVS